MDIYFILLIITWYYLIYFLAPMAPFQAIGSSFCGFLCPSWQTSIPARVDLLCVVSELLAHILSWEGIVSNKVQHLHTVSFYFSFTGSTLCKVTWANTFSLYQKVIEGIGAKMLVNNESLDEFAKKVQRQWDIWRKCCCLGKHGRRQSRWQWQYRRVGGGDKNTVVQLQVARNEGPVGQMIWHIKMTAGLSHLQAKRGLLL